MTDSKKNEFEDGFGDGDFAFDDAPDWDDAPEEPKGADTKASADPFKDAFGEEALDDEADDIFGSAGDSNSSDDFAEAAAGFSGNDEGGFDFQEMLTPDSVAESAAPQGNPEDEFEDLAGGSFDGEAFASADGFDDGSSLFDDGEDSPSDGGFDPDNDPFNVDETESASAGENPFEEDAVPADGDYADAPTAEERGRNRFIVPAALAAAAVFAGYVGYTAVLPMFLSPAAPPVVTAQQELPPSPTFPTALPGQPGGLDTVEEPLQQLPASPADPVLPVVPATPTFTLPDLAETPGVQAADQQAQVQVPLPSAQDTGEDVPSLDDIVGGEGRGGIAAMRDPVSVTDGERVDMSAFESRLDAIEEKVDMLAERIQRQASTVSPSFDPALSRADRQPSAEQPVVSDLAGLTPPLKPEIIGSATLKGVSRDLAWVSTASGVVEVREGDTIPGGGRVLKIREYEGNWIVVTTDGIVVQ